MDKKNYSVISIVSLIAGVIGMLTTCLFVGIIPCIAGLVLSIISFFEKGTKKILSVIGMVCSIIGIVLFIILMAIPSEDTDKTKKSEENKTEVSATEIPKETQKPKEKATAKPTEKQKTKKQIKNEYISSCKEYSHKKILRKPDDYTDKKIKVRVTILNLHESIFGKYYIAEDNNGNLYTINEEREKEEPRLYEKDKITVYGNILGLSEIESSIQTGSKVLNFLQEKEKQTVVEIDLKYAKLKN